MKQSAKIIPYKRDEKLYPPYDAQKKADDYQFSLNKSRAILLSIFCAAIGVLLFSAGWIIGFMMRPVLVNDPINLIETSAKKGKKISGKAGSLDNSIEVILSDTENILKNLIELSIQRSGKKSSPKLFFSALNKSFWNKKDDSGLIKSFVIPAKDMNKFFQKKYFSLILEVFPDKASADEGLKAWRDKKKYNPYLLEAKDFAGKSHFVLILDDYDNFEKVKNADLNTNINEKKFGLIAYADTDKPLRKFGISWTDDENALRPYTLRVASFRTKKEADDGFKYYTDSGLSPYMVRLYNGKKGGSHQWVVYAGPYQSSKEALDARKALPKSVKAVFTDRIGYYANYIDEFYEEREAEKMCEQLLLLRLKSPLHIVRKNDVFKVFVGLHKQRKAAETDNEKLKKSGIESRVVAR